MQQQLLSSSRRGGGFLPVLLLLLGSSALPGEVVAAEGEYELLGAISSSWAAKEGALAKAEEAEDRDYWTSAWANLESELRGLAQVAASARPAALGSAPAGFWDKGGTAAFSGSLVSGSSSDSSWVGAQIGVLQGLYDEGKKKIAELNQHERLSKQTFATHEQEHADRLTALKALNHSHAGAAVRERENSEASFLFNYWSRVRKRSRKQYRNMLRIEHGTMQMEKNLIDQYQKAQGAAAAQPGPGPGPVGVAALVQEHKRGGGGGGGGAGDSGSGAGDSGLSQAATAAAGKVAEFCANSLEEVRAAQNVLRNWHDDFERSLDNGQAPFARATDQFMGVRGAARSGR